MNNHQTPPMFEGGTCRAYLFELAETAARLAGRNEEERQEAETAARKIGRRRQIIVSRTGLDHRHDPCRYRRIKRQHVSDNFATGARGRTAATRGDIVRMTWGLRFYRLAPLSTYHSHGAIEHDTNLPHKYHGRFLTC